MTALVPRPGFEAKVFYVWFDAPIGYIAATLLVSVRTVESHLAACYRKLDISSRQALREILAAAV